MGDVRALAYSAVVQRDVACTGKRRFSDRPYMATSSQLRVVSGCASYRDTDSYWV